MGLRPDRRGTCRDRRGGAARHGIASATQIQGKELSFNNLNDTDAALELICEFDAAVGPAVAIIKHANPCGVGIDDAMSEAFLKARATDPISAFGELYSEDLSG